MRLKILFVLLFVTLYYVGFSQTMKPLQVGDQIPDVTIRGFFDDDRRSVKISELYKGKLLILDFWGTWCAACLTEMMTFPQLKSQFGDKLNIVAVGYESKKVLADLFKRSPAFHSNLWITLYGDTILTRSLFPHKSLPHLAWINSSGKVIAITEGDYLNSTNIKNALTGKTLDARIKQDLLGVDDMEKPFHLKDTSFLARSIITRRVQGVSFDSKQPFTALKPYKFDRIFLANETLESMYWFALADGTIAIGNNARMRVETKDSLKYIHPNYAPQSFKLSKYKNYDDWADSNLYCYDLKLPKLTSDSLIRQYMLADLNRYFNLKGRWENRLTDCFIIQDDNNFKKGKSVVSSQTDVSDSSVKKIEEINLDNLADYFNRRIKSGIIINESKLPPNSKVRLETRYKTLDPHQIAAVLHEAGLILIEAKRKVPVYIISEK